MCTVLACAADAGPKACPAIARICKDGSSPKLGDDCAQICPEDTVVACPADALKCPDGSYVTRTGPNCEFGTCGGGTVCPAIVKKCPDGSYVSPTGPNCAFPDCPTQGESCSQLMSDASTALAAAADQNSDCNTADDCQSIVPGAACVYGQCFAAVAKAHVADYNAAKTKIEQTTCAQFQSDKCGPPPVAACPAHATIVTCNSNHKCQAQ
jgi:hypothetical protein